MSERFFKLGVLEVELSPDNGDLALVRFYGGGVIDGRARYELRRAHVDKTNDLLWLEPWSIESATERFNAQWLANVFVSGLPDWSQTSYAIEFDRLLALPLVIGCGSTPTRELPQYTLTAINFRVSRTVRSIAAQVLAGEFEGAPAAELARIRAMLSFAAPQWEHCERALQLLDF